MLKDWLKLLYTKSVSLAQKRALVCHFGSPGQIFRADPAQLRQTNIVSENGLLAIYGSDYEKIAPDITLLKNTDSHYIGFNDPGFPALLNQIPSPPLGLFYRGNVDLLGKPQIAVVGSRNASPNGKRTTFEFSALLSRAGLIITSGMAAGIDSEAHAGCLHAGNPTIAVLGTGIDRIYPYSNRSLYENIATQGLLVSEFPLGTKPNRRNFPQRNRIISGLSMATLVVEAGVRSGSLITARLAAEQGRDVFAIPGSIHNPTSKGCHYLIRQGARLVESVEDIVQEFQSIHLFDIPELSENSVTSAQIEENPLYNLIDYAPTSIDELIERSGLTADKVSSILVELELKGAIAEINGGYQRLA